jgi:hypothetical protein
VLAAGVGRPGVVLQNVDGPVPRVLDDDVRTLVYDVVDRSVAGAVARIAATDEAWASVPAASVMATASPAMVAAPTAAAPVVSAATMMPTAAAESA